MRLNKRTIDAAQYQGGTDYRWDDNLRGFGLRVYPSGQRSFVVSYRAKGRKRIMVLGAYGVMTVSQARKEARKALTAVDAGQDPAADRRKARQIEKLQDLAELWMRGQEATKSSVRGIRESRRLLDTKILPRFGSRSWRGLSVEEVTRWHSAMASAPVEANRAVGKLSTLLNYGQRRDPRADWVNPCGAVERFPERSRERFLSEKELAELGRVLAEVEQEATELPSVVPAFRLLILTGARLSEILTLEWSHVDFRHRCLRLPTSKSGKKTIPLGSAALQLLTDWPEVDGNAYVLPGAKPGRHIVNVTKPWRRIRSRAGLDDVRIHDLRHSFASMGVAGGLSLPVVGAILGHADAATTQRYAHLADDPVRRGVEATSNAIAAALGGEVGEIVPFQRAVPAHRSR